MVGTRLEELFTRTLLEERYEAQAETRRTFMAAAAFSARASLHSRTASPFCSRVKALYLALSVIGCFMCALLCNPSVSCATGPAGSVGLQPLGATAEDRAGMLAWWLRQPL